MTEKVHKKTGSKTGLHRIVDDVLLLDMLIDLNQFRLCLFGDRKMDL